MNSRPETGREHRPQRVENGHGHPRAAGCEISGNPDNAKHAILEEVKKELDRVDAEKEAQ